MRLALLFIVLSAAPAPGEEAFTSNGLKWDMTKGSKHLLATSAIAGAGAASGVFIAMAASGPGRDLVFAGAATVGLIALFMGGGLTAGHLFDPTPPMAWSTFFAGAAGATVAMCAMTLGMSPPSPEVIILGMSLGYVLAAGIDLLLPGRSTMSWKEFWIPMLASIIPGGALILGGVLSNAFFRNPELLAATLIYPLASFLITRAILAFTQPFDPWVDDLKPPFRAEPIIGLSPSGARVGLAATW